MQISRIVTGSDGRSHFQDEELRFEPQGPGAEVSAPIAVRRAIFRRSNPEADTATAPLHPSSQRLLVVKLSGHIEIEVGDGSSRVFGPGSVHFLEDETGEGHRGRLLSDESLTLILELAPEEPR